MHSDQYSQLLAILGTDDGAYDWNIEEKTFWASDRWLEILGFTRDEFTGKEEFFFGRPHPEDLPLIKKALDDYFSGKKEMFVFQCRVLRKDNILVWVYARGKVYEWRNEKPVRMAGTITDITREKEYEQKLLNTQRMLNEAQRVAQIGSWELDAETEKVWWSDELFRLTGISKAAGAPKISEHHTWVHPDDLSYFLGQVKKVWIDKFPYQFEFRIKKPNGEVIWALATGECVLSNEKIIKIHGTCQDITTRKELEKKVDEDKIRLTEVHKQTSLGILATNLSHEINNPLTIILGQARVIQSEMQDKIELVSPLISIESAVSRIEGIVKSLQYFSSKYEKERPNQLFVSEIITDIFRLFQIKFKNADIELKLDIESGLQVFAKRHELLNIFLNLLTNSLDSIQGSRNAWVKIQGKRVENKIEIRFTDSGEGLTHEIEKQLFDPFFSTKENKSAMGLGLPIVKTLMENMGGHVEYQKYNGHTSFVLSFNGFEFF